VEKQENVIDHIEYFEEKSLPTVSPSPTTNFDWNRGINDEKDDSTILFHIVMELAPHGNLHTFLNQNKPQENEIYGYIRDVCAGLCFLHDHGIVHKKLKLSDLVMTKDHHIKIAGLGITLEKFNDDSPYGEQAHLSPEVVKNTKITPAADIWSLGVVIFQLINWSSEVTSHLFYSEEKIAEALKDKDPILAKICTACLHMDPAMRPTPKEILAMLIN
jgi:serine/threonine protein kinase